MNYWNWIIIPHNIKSNSFITPVDKKHIISIPYYVNFSKNSERICTNFDCRIVSRINTTILLANTKKQFNYVIQIKKKFN